MVTSFRNTVPVFAFVRRKNVALSLDDEQTDEEELQAAVTKAATILRQTSSMDLVDYTSTTEVSPLPGRYVLFWELVDSRCVYIQSTEQYDLTGNSVKMVISQLSI